MVDVRLLVIVLSPDVLAEIVPLKVGAMLVPEIYRLFASRIGTLKFGVVAPTKVSVEALPLLSNVSVDPPLLVKLKGLLPDESP